MRVTYEINKVSEYITAKEAWGSSQTARRKGINNTPPLTHLVNMMNLGEKFFDPLRRYFGHPIIISSMYRGKQLNKEIGGAKRSDHLTGEAVDIDMDGTLYTNSNNDIFEYIRKNCRFYKLIAEFPKDGKISWVHVSYKKEDCLNDERQVYIAYRSAVGTQYVPYDEGKHLLKK